MRRNVVDMTYERVEIGVYEPRQQGGVRRAVRLPGLSDVRPARVNILAGIGALCVNVAAIVSISLAVQPDPRPAILKLSSEAGYLLVSSIRSDSRRDDSHPLIDPVEARRLERVPIDPSLDLKALAELLQDTEPVIATDEAEVAKQKSETIRLEGIYSQQIAARIQRTLEFNHLRGQAACRAVVTQIPSGAVTEVDLQDCGASAEWQRGVMDAIRQAAPLPAPPRADIFNETIKVDIGRDVTVRM